MLLASADMPIPEGIGAVDLMIGFPSADARSHYDNLRAMTKDAASADMEFPAEYMFKQVPNHLPEGADPIEVALGEMDRCGVAIGMIGSARGEVAQRALKEHPDRFVASLSIDPNDITGAVREIRKAKDELRHQGRDELPGRLQSAGAGQRPSLLPHLPDLHRSGHPDRAECRHSGTPTAGGVPGRHALRRGLLRLPGADASSCATAPSLGRSWP